LSETKVTHGALNLGGLLSASSRKLQDLLFEAVDFITLDVAVTVGRISVRIPETVKKKGQRNEP